MDPLDYFIQGIALLGGFGVGMTSGISTRRYREFTRKQKVIDLLQTNVTYLAMNDGVQVAINYAFADINGYRILKDDPAWIIGVTTGYLLTAKKAPRKPKEPPKKHKSIVRRLSEIKVPVGPAIPLRLYNEIPEQKELY